MIKASSILLILLPVFVCQANNVWTPVGVGLSIRNLVDVASVPGGFVAVGSETLLYGSKNTWTKVNAPVAADFVAVAFLGGTGVAVASTGEIVSSGDGGKTWQLSSFNTQSATLYDVKARAADGFWIAASNGKIFRISPDLSAFSADTLGPLTVFSKIVVTPQAVWALTANGERFVRRSNGSWADSGNVLGAYSVQGLSLGPIEILPSGYWLSASKVASVGIAAGATLQNVIRHSLDGETWTDTLVWVDPDAMGKRVFGIGGMGDSLVMLAGEKPNGSAGTSYFAEIRPGQSCHEVSSGVRSQLNSVVTNGSESVVVGNAGLILSNAVDSSTFVLPKSNQSLRSWSLKVKNYSILIHGLGLHPKGWYPLELLDSMGKLYPLTAKVSDGELDLLLPVRFGHQPLLLRSRSDRLHFEPVLLY